MNKNDSLNSKVDFSCQYNNNFGPISILFEQFIKSPGTQKTKASQTDLNVLFHKEQYLNDHFDAILYNDQSKIDFGIQTTNFAIQNDNEFYQNTKMINTKKLEIKELISFEDSSKIDSSIKPIENFEIQTLNSILQSSNDFYEKNNLNDSKESKYQESSLFKEYFRIDSYIEPIENIKIQTTNYVSNNMNNSSTLNELNNNKKFEFQEFDLSKDSLKVDYDMDTIKTFENFKQLNDNDLDFHINSKNKFEHDTLNIDISTTIYNISCHYIDSSLIEPPLVIKKESEYIDTSSLDLKDNTNNSSNSKNLELDKTLVLERHESMMYTNMHTTILDINSFDKTKNNCLIDTIIETKDNYANEYDLDEFENDVELTSTKIDGYDLQTNISNDSPLCETVASLQHSQTNEESLCLESFSDIPMWNPCDERTLSDKLKDLSECNANESKYSFEDVSIELSSSNELLTPKENEVDALNNDEYDINLWMNNNNVDESKNISKNENAADYIIKNTPINMFPFNDTSSLINNTPSTSYQNQMHMDTSKNDKTKTSEVNIVTKVWICHIQIWCT